MSEHFNTKRRRIPQENENGPDDSSHRKDRPVQGPLVASRVASGAGSPTPRSPSVAPAESSDSRSSWVAASGRALRTASRSSAGIERSDHNCLAGLSRWTGRPSGSMPSVRA
jgi:hypothetical protein